MNLIQCRSMNGRCVLSFRILRENMRLRLTATCALKPVALSERQKTPRRAESPRCDSFGEYSMLPLNAKHREDSPLSALFSISMPFTALDSSSSSPECDFVLTPLAQDKAKLRGQSYRFADVWLDLGATLEGKEGSQWVFPSARFQRKVPTSSSQ